MRRMLTLAVCFLALNGSSALAQRTRSEEDFVKEKPAVGDPLPDVTIYSPDGKEVKTSGLRDHYTVLTFGCLT